MASVSGRKTLSFLEKITCIIKMMMLDLAQVIDGYSVPGTSQRTKLTIK